MVTNKPSWKHFLLLSCFASSPLVSACIEPTVIGGGEGTGSGGSGASGSGGAGQGGGQPATNAVAMFWDEMPPFPGDPSGSSSGVGGGSQIPADTLYVKLSSLPVTCQDPYSIGAPGGCDTGWHLSVSLPVAYQAVGVYQLDDPNINALVTEELNDGGEACSGGGGWYLEGTFEVLNIDSQGLVVQVMALNEVKLDGMYEVPRCYPLPDDPTDPSGIAIRYDQFPPVGGSGSSVATSTSSGGGPEADTLYAMIANHAITCGDPYGSADDCPYDRWVVSIGLPLAYQTPGVYSLSDPNIIAYTSESGPNGDGTCWGGGGSFFGGTIEVVSVDQGGITVKFDGVDDHAAELAAEHYLPRCL